MDIYDGDLQYGFNLVFDYDESGKLISVSEPGFTFFYIRDGLGNIIKLVDEQGNDVVKYSYDSWGKVTINTISSLHPSARFNPFMYKGYIYDVETGLYYCNSRYYSPELCRWISPDSIEYLDPESINGLNLYCYCMNNPIMYVDPTGHFAISTLILCGLALVGMGLTIGGVASDNNVMTAIGLTMVAVPALISGVGALFSGATYLSIIGGVTTVAGVGTGMFASAEYQEAFTGNNWMLDAGMSEEWYNGLMLATAAIATAGTIATGVLTSIGSSATPNQMMNSFNKHPNRWKTVKELIEPGRGKNKGGISTYSNHINKWTGSKLGIHKIIRGGKFIHGPHIHFWI